MKKILILSIILIVNCGENNPIAPDTYIISDLVGIWEKISLVSITTENGQGGETLTWTPDSNNSETITIYNDGSFTSIRFDEGVEDNGSGQFILDGSNITVTFDELEANGTISITNNIMVLNLLGIILGTGENGDGNWEVELTMIYEKVN